MKLRFAFIWILLEVTANLALSQNIMPRPADFPTPATNQQLFFVQRNRNKNTIIYDYNQLKNGEFNSSKPIEVYWLKSSGVKAQLTWLQRNFAFGYHHKKDHSSKGFWITLSAYDGRKIHLEKTTQGKPVATMTINGKYCQLLNIWVFADESGSWPKVLHVDLHGKDMVSGKLEMERIFNK